MREYPEHEKLAAVKDAAQAIGEFLEFGGYTLCRWEPDMGDYPVPVGLPITRVLADYFDIDLSKIEQEKRAMLNELCAKQAQP